MSSCNSCLISQGAYADVNAHGGTIELGSDWTLNHYLGPEGFLGWVILQPRYHRIDISELEQQEATSLGTNIKLVDSALREYWRQQFPADPIQRVYVVYFHESVFRNPDLRKPSQDWHMHFHLIARTERMAALLRTFDAVGHSIRAWSMPDVLPKKPGEFPNDYMKDKQNTSQLMAYLKAALAPMHGW